MLSYIKKILKLFSKKKEYPYIIEVRPTFEKALLKSIISNTKIKGIYTQTPHITLIYNFSPKITSYKIMDIIANTLKKQYIKIIYDGYDIFKGKNGYVVSFKIKSPQLYKFQKSLYNNLKSYIEVSNEVLEYNKNPHLHCTISYKVRDIENIVLPKEIYLESYVLRITLLRRGKIVYEYDVPTNKILKRSEALSKRMYSKTLLNYRNDKLFMPKSNANIYFISDTHFNHDNIIKYCARPFIDSKEMNKEIIRYWNKTVNSHDTVYFLGDLSIGKFNHSKLNGNIVFIKGNHDKTGINHYLLKKDDRVFLLIHNPNSKIATEYNGWIIHGHTHNNNLKKYPLINPKTKTINVSAEVVNYHPISLDLILKLIKMGKKINTIDDVIS